MKPFFFGVPDKYRFSGGPPPPDSTKKTDIPLPTFSGQPRSSTATSQKVTSVTPIDEQCQVGDQLADESDDEDSEEDIEPIESYNVSQKKVRADVRRVSQLVVMENLAEDFR